MIGIRPGEKIHEEMITASDSFNTVDLGDYYAILPPSGKHSVASYTEIYGGESVPEDYSYNSGSNSQFLSVDQIRKLIREHCDTEFVV